MKPITPPGHLRCAGPISLLTLRGIIARRRGTPASELPVGITTPFTEPLRTRRRSNGSRKLGGLRKPTKPLLQSRTIGARFAEGRQARDRPFTPTTATKQSARGNCCVHGATSSRAGYRPILCSRKRWLTISENGLPRRHYPILAIALHHALVPLDGAGMQPVRDHIGGQVVIGR